MKRWSTLLRERYRIVSEMGIDALKDIIRRQEKGMCYWDAIKSHYLDFNPNVDEKKNKKFREIIEKIEWKP